MTHTMPTTIPKPDFMAFSGGRPGTLSRLEFDSGLVRAIRTRRRSRPIYNAAWHLSPVQYAILLGFAHGDDTAASEGVGAQWFNWLVCAPFREAEETHVVRALDWTFSDSPAGWRGRQYVLRATARIEFSTSGAAPYTEPAGAAPVPGTIS